MAYYKLSVRYKNEKTYQTYSSVLLDIARLRFGIKGAKVLRPFSSNGEYPPVESTSLEALNALSLNDLRDVHLGDGILTEIEVQEGEE